MAMFDCAVTLSNGEGAREDIAESLSKIGIEQPTVFLSAAYTFLMQHSKVYGKFISSLIHLLSRVFTITQLRFHIYFLMPLVSFENSPVFQ